MFFLRICRPTLLWATKATQLGIYYAGKLFFARAYVEVRGINRIQNFHGNAIFAANHANEFDPAVVCLALEKAGLLRERLPVLFLSREKAFYSDMGFVRASLYGGFLFRLCGAYPVTPKNERKAGDVRNTLRTHRDFLAQGYSIVIFPEGTRTTTGKLLSPKAGVGVLSEQANCPVIPLAIEGTFGLSFSDFLSGKKRVRVTFGEPIFPKRNNLENLLYFFSRKRRYVEKARFVMRCIDNMLHESPEIKK